MALYKCKCGKEKTLSKVKIIYINNGWFAKEALCECGQYMEAEPEEGMPNLIRTEEPFTKEKRRDKLWEGAKEKLVGERGVNESFK